MNADAECNWEKLKERLQDIENTMLGLKTPVSKLVCDETGLATVDRVKALVDAVISHQCCLNGKYIGIQGADKRYLELLFYLIFRAYDPDERILYFGNLLEVAEEMKHIYKSRDELILRDAELIGRPLGFFAMIWESCKLLTGRSLADDMTAEELKQMKKEYVLKENAYEKKFVERKKLFEIKEHEKDAIREKYADYGIEGYDDYWDAIDPDFWSRYSDADLAFEKESIFYQDEMEGAELSDTWSIRQRRYLTVEENKKRNAKKEAWLKSFADPEEYLRAYREFSELHFYVNVISGVPSLRDSILWLLEKEGFNRMGDDEKFTSLYAELNRALRIARRKY